MGCQIMHYKYINLGCGPVFIDSPDWLNLDYVPTAAAVRKANLMDQLPVPQSSAILVYSSHFLEHVPRAQVSAFLAECHRILAADGVLRLVLPDLENLCRAYLMHRDQGEHEQANFIVLEMIDQCVRKETGGELGNFYKKLKSASYSSQMMVDFIRDRTGEDLALTITGREQFFGWGRIIRVVLNRLERFWVRAVLKLLPGAFRTQNVSLSDVGERHQWLWDFHQLQALLVELGFTNIVRYTADTSGFVGFPFQPLDLDSSGRPRKGAESMYIEARKAG